MNRSLRVHRRAARTLARGALRLGGAIALLLVTTAGLCGPSVPAPDVCEQSSDPGIIALEVGQAALDAVFVPWQEGQVVPVVVGGQGSPMFAMRVRIHGQDASCIPLDTQVVSAQGDTVADERLLLAAYQQDDGSFVTDTHWVVLQTFSFSADDGPFTVQVSVGGGGAARTIVLDE